MKNFTGRHMFMNPNKVVVHISAIRFSNAQNEKLLKDLLTREKSAYLMIRPYLHIKKLFQTYTHHISQNPIYINITSYINEVFNHDP